MVTVDVIESVGIIATILGGFITIWRFGINPRIGGLSDKIDSLIDRFSSLENKVNENTREIASLKTKVDMMCQNPSIIDKEKMKKIEEGKRKK